MELLVEGAVDADPAMVSALDPGLLISMLLWPFEWSAWVPSVVTESPASESSESDKVHVTQSNVLC